MASCYDCIHCGACSDAGDSGFSSLKEDVSGCKHFKNKADVVEVVHGRWIRHKENCLYNKCSICCYEHCRENNYCPNCGAKMDGTPKERGGEK